MAQPKLTVAQLAAELEKLEQYRDEAINQRDLEPTVTVKVVASADIEITRNQKNFFDGLIKTLNLTIDETKREIQELMFPPRPINPGE